MHHTRTMKLATAASALVLATMAAQPLQAQSAGPENARSAMPAMTPYQKHVARAVTDKNWYAVEREGYQAQRARANFEVRTENDLTIYERRDLDQRGRIAQRARGARLPTQAALAPEFREHAARLGADPNWNEVETRGVQAQRNRVGFEIRSATDLTPQERFELDRQGRAAQRARGARLPTQPVASTRANRNPGQPRRTAIAGLTSNTRMPAGRTGMTRIATRVSAAANSLADISSRASKLDFATEAFGGRELGVSRFGSDMTIGQLENSLRGGDPVIAAAHATRRLGNNLRSGLTGIGESIVDPRRIPGNAARAVNGAAEGAVQTVGWAANTAANTTRDVGRALTDPDFARQKVQEAGRTVQNVGQSICKGLSWLIPSNTNRGGC